jgi:hypothetical protein
MRPLTHARTAIGSVLTVAVLMVSFNELVLVDVDDFRDFIEPMNRYPAIHSNGYGN